MLEYDPTQSICPHSAVFFILHNLEVSQYHIHIRIGILNLHMICMLLFHPFVCFEFNACYSKFDEPLKLTHYLCWVNMPQFVAILRIDVAILSQLPSPIDIRYFVIDICVLCLLILFASFGLFINWVFRCV